MRNLRGLPDYGESEIHKTVPSGKVCIRAVWPCIWQEYDSPTFLRCHFLDAAPGGIETTVCIRLSKHRPLSSHLQPDVHTASFLDSPEHLSGNHHSPEAGAQLI